MLSAPPSSGRYHHGRDDQLRCGDHSSAASFGVEGGERREGGGGEGGEMRVMCDEISGVACIERDSAMGGFIAKVRCSFLLLLLLLVGFLLLPCTPRPPPTPMLVATSRGKWKVISQHCSCRD